MKMSISKSTSVALAAAFVLSFQSPSQAQAQSGLFGAQEVKRWDMCDWTKIPDGVLARIERRNDYEDILRRMFNSCPDSALALTDRPTATTNDASDNRDDQRGREPDNGGAPDGGGEDGSPDDGPEDNGPPDSEPPNGGPPNGGPPNGGPPNGGPPSSNPPPTG